jgi:hypothetical protein
VVEYEALTRELEALGVDEVRARLLNNQYGKVGHKREIAQDWLNRKDMAQQREIAKRASDAADEPQTQQPNKQSKLSEPIELPSPRLSSPS